jgi:hypothetical protein
MGTALTIGSHYHSQLVASVARIGGGELKLIICTAVQITLQKHRYARWQAHAEQSIPAYRRRAYVLLLFARTRSRYFHQLSHSHDTRNHSYNQACKQPRLKHWSLLHPIKHKLHVTSCHAALLNLTSFRWVRLCTPGQDHAAGPAQPNTPDTHRTWLAAKTLTSAPGPVNTSLASVSATWRGCWQGRGLPSREPRIECQGKTPTGGAGE